MRPYFAFAARMISMRWPLASFGSESTTRRPLAFAFHVRGVAGRFADAADVFFAAADPAFAAVVAPPAAPVAGAAGAAGTPATPVTGPAAIRLLNWPPHWRNGWIMYVCAIPGARPLIVNDEPMATSNGTNVPFGWSSEIS